MTAHPFFNVAREIVAGQVAYNDKIVSGGVSWSGLTTDRRVKVETVEECAERLERQHAKHLAFTQTPRGRLIGAIKDIWEAAGYGAEAYKLEAIYRSSLADEREPLNTEAVGASLAVLNGIPGRSARVAIDALAELLMETGQRVAA